MKNSEQRIIDGLNEEQREVVTAQRQNILVLAGAGTGKTRVLVSRIAYLVEHCGVDSNRILAVTFTNKAAREMRERLIGLLGEYSVRRLWAYTFHTASSHILRNFAEEAGLTRNFTIIDTSDQLALVKRVMQDLNLPADICVNGIRYNSRNYLQKIMDEKSRGHRPGMEGSSILPCFYDVYALYQTRCDKSDQVDFEELILRTCELIESNPQVRHYIRLKFQEILVDEFQDTSSLQYRWLKLVSGIENLDSGKHPANVLIVGDDDQSIYGWRGAAVENMFYFQKEFSPVKLVKLVQNYRSTKAILSNANSLIKNNSKHVAEKTLITRNPDATMVKLMESYDSSDEADEIAKIIRKLIDNLKKDPSEIAVLYRTNAQSRMIEKAMVEYGVDYNIYGGARFFDREEIKNTLAYLRLIVNPEDNISFNRIVNVPSRKIGKVTLGKIEALRREFGISMFKAAEMYALKNKSRSLQNFIELIHGFSARVAESPKNMDDIVRFLESVIEDSGLGTYYREKSAMDDADSSNDRFGNIEELISDISGRDYDELSDQGFDNAGEVLEDGKEISKSRNTDDNSVPENKKMKYTIADFIQIYLSSAALMPSSELLKSEEDSAVNLMTIHCSKGLEFEVVIIAGFEKGLLPLERYSSIKTDQNAHIEEERRLAYVAITRAKELLFLSCANWHSSYDGQYPTGPSPFTYELDSCSIDTDMNFLDA
ncbi:ATP-dependent helicase [Succinimonas amylolytica]|uniref:ATP-dependent helicase n=1 Tax=Succinimonas amylolytica TaxID=83769 RepID=UPI0023A880C6